jgi:hypothetical protein
MVVMARAHNQPLNAHVAHTSFQARIRFPPLPTSVCKFQKHFWDACVVDCPVPSYFAPMLQQHSPVQQQAPTLPARASKYRRADATVLDLTPDVLLRTLALTGCD